MKVRKVPLRKCVACQEMLPKKELLRIVRTPEGDVVLDLTGKKSGRGAYVCPKQGCFEAARKRKSLERALDVKMGDEMYEELLRALPQQ